MTALNDKKNQLKLNLDAPMTNLNLVNIIKVPKPIVIENVANTRYYDNRYTNYDSNNRSTSSVDFKFIDEGKLSMYSFLAKRKLQEQEWRAKYLSENMIENNNNNKKTNKNVKNNQIVGNKTSIKAPNSARSINSMKEKQINENNNNNNNINKPIDTHLSITPIELKYTEIKNICKKIFELIVKLEEVLNEYSINRLQVVYFDEKEEIKQIKIENEQIKNSSRLMYNFQNQLKQFEDELTKKVLNENEKKLLLSRVINTQRYVTKTIDLFIQKFPYRKDNATKLYKNLFKHLYSTISNYIFICSHFKLNSDNVLNNINTNLKRCEQILNSIVDDINEDDENNEKIKRANNKEKKPKKPEFTVDNRKIIKKIKVNPVVKELQTKPRPQSAMQPTRPILVNKKVKTGRLFPSARNKSTSPHRSPHRNVHEVLPPKSPREGHKVCDTCCVKRSRSLEELEKRQKNEYESTPIQHRNSPKTYRSPPRKAFFNEDNNSYYYESNSHRHRQHNHENYSDDNEYYQIDLHEKYKNLNSNKSNNNNNNNLNRNYNNINVNNNNNNNNRQVEHDFNRSFDIQNSPFKSYSPVKKPFINHCMERLTLMKEENDSIRRKYEKLKYTNDISLTKKYIPYAELYAKIDSEEIKKQNNGVFPVDKPIKGIEDEQPVASFVNIDRQLRKPSTQQLERVLEYNRRFKNYSKRNTLIENTDVDELELFNRLSDDLALKCFTNVCNELENLNNDYTNKVFEAEFVENK